MSEPLVYLRRVEKNYVLGGVTYPVLRGVDLNVRTGEFVSIVGPSGNGKSTLLNLLAGIDRPTSGVVEIGGQSLGKLGEERLAVWRGKALGIVFQFFQLLPSLTLAQNIILAMDLVGVIPHRSRKDRAFELLDWVGLINFADRLPGQVSGGQQQRAAIARALANNPPLILADEPTGNLDAQTAEDVFGLLGRLVEKGRTIIMVTHNRELADRTSRVLELRSGRIVADRPPLPGHAEDVANL